MKSLIEILTLSTDYLSKKGIVNPRRQAEDLLCDIFGMDRLRLYVEFERPLNEAEVSLCRERLLRRAQGEPLQYIHGQVDFYGCAFLITPATLIPRQETEILADLITKTLEKQDVKKKVLWDVCCGSGCLGISLKKQFPDLQVILSDISHEALAVARQNAEKNQVGVQFLEGDLLAPFHGKKADYIVCNPPYISDAEYEVLDKEVRCFEPKTALVSGETGFEIYERLAVGMKPYLNFGARVWFEIGYTQGERIDRIFEEAGWKSRKVEKDWSGQDRFFFLENV